MDIDPDVVERDKVDRMADGVEHPDRVLAVHKAAESVQTTEDSTADREPAATADRHEAGSAHQEKRSQL